MRRPSLIILMTVLLGAWSPLWCCCSLPRSQAAGSSVAAAGDGCCQAKAKLRESKVPADSCPTQDGGPCRCFEKSERTLAVEPMALPSFSPWDYPSSLSLAAIDILRPAASPMRLALWLDMPPPGGTPLVRLHIQLSE